MNWSIFKGPAIILIVFLQLLCISGCKEKETQKQVLNRFEVDLFNEQSNKQGQDQSILVAKYPDFYPIFTEHIIGIGKPDDLNINTFLQQFISDPVIKEVYSETLNVYPNFESLASRISSSIEDFQKKAETEIGLSITTYISGFNQSFVALPNHLAIGLDNYLGSDYTYYQQLRLPLYIIESMKPESLYADAVRAWIQSELESRLTPESLLDQIIYDGILLYAAQQVLPKSELLNLFHYTQDQWDWCKKNEKAMWTYLVENEILYSTDPLLIRRLTGEAPFSRDFGLDSPPKAGSWIGYRIVEKMMAKQKLSLKKLIFELSYSEILSLSAYRPKGF